MNDGIRPQCKGIPAIHSIIHAKVCFLFALHYVYQCLHDCVMTHMDTGQVAPTHFPAVCTISVSCEYSRCLSASRKWQCNEVKRCNQGGNAGSCPSRDWSKNYFLAPRNVRAGFCQEDLRILQRWIRELGIRNSLSVHGYHRSLNSPWRTRDISDMTWHCDLRK